MCVHACVRVCVCVCMCVYVCVCSCVCVSLLYRFLQCTKLHAYYCPEYTIYGECARGTDCPLKHRKQARLTVSRRKKSKQAQLTNAKTPKAFKRNKAIEAACDDGGNGDGEEKIGSESSVVALRPLDLNEMPDFIPL